LSAYEEAPKKGFNTKFEGKDLYYWSNLVLNLSKKGLDNRNIFNEGNLNESKFLAHTREIIKSKTTNAENILNRFKNNKNLINFYEK
jgi:glutamate--cysteine ligase